MSLLLTFEARYVNMRPEECLLEDQRGAQWPLDAGVMREVQRYRGSHTVRLVRREEEDADDEREDDDETGEEEAEDGEPDVENLMALLNASHDDEADEGGEGGEGGGGDDAAAAPGVVDDDSDSDDDGKQSSALKVPRPAAARAAIHRSRSSSTLPGTARLAREERRRGEAALGLRPACPPSNAPTRLVAGSARCTRSPR